MKKSYEQTHYGVEPEWAQNFKDQVESDCALIKAINWYNYISTMSDQKQWFIDYLKQEKSTEETVKLFEEAPNEMFKISYGENTNFLFGFKPGIYARLFLRQAPLPDSIKNQLKISIDILKNKIQKQNIKLENKPQINIQKAIADATSKFIDKLNVIYDKIMQDLISNEMANQEIEKLFKLIPAIHCSKIMEYFNTVLTELLLVNKDNDLKEGYSIYTADKLKSLKSCINKINTEAEKILDIKKKTPIIRKRKQKSPFKLVEKLQFLKENTEYNLTSIIPSYIIGAEKLLVFNTKTRTIYLYEADSQYGLSVKGTSVVGYDSKSSISKKLRKPKIFFASIKDKGIRAVKNAINDCSCQSKPAKSRINSDCILYSVY